jgi:hypothetical protein
LIVTWLLPNKSLLGLRENIFAQLETSDYLVFVDFKREELKTAAVEQVCRGSLFSHQELAIASFLEIPSLIFQERGLLPLDGMLGAMQANAIPFSDRNLLQSGDWRMDSKNALSMVVADPPFTEALQKNGALRRFFHIGVRNHHHRKAALYCCAYLDEVENLTTKELSHPKSVELKWAGTLLPAVRIGPSAIRQLDGVNFSFQAHSTPFLSSRYFGHLLIRPTMCLT